MANDGSSAGFGRLRIAVDNLGTSIEKSRLVKAGRHNLAHEVFAPITEGEPQAEQSSLLRIYTQSVRSAAREVSVFDFAPGGVGLFDTDAARETINILDNAGIAVDVLGPAINAELDPLWVVRNTHHTSDLVVQHAEAIVASRFFACTIAGVPQLGFRQNSLREVWDQAGYRPTVNA